MKLKEANHWKNASYIDRTREKFIIDKPYCAIDGRSLLKITREGWADDCEVLFNSRGLCKCDKNKNVLEPGLDINGDGYLIVLKDDTVIKEKPPMRYTRFLSFHECKEIINNQIRHIDAVYHKSWRNDRFQEVQFIVARDSFIERFQSKPYKHTVGLYYKPLSKYFNDGLPLEDFFSDDELNHHVWYHASDPWD